MSTTVPVCLQCRYLGDKVLVTRVVGGDDGEDVPVVLLHDVQDDGRLLFDGRAELKEHGVVVLDVRQRHTHTDGERSQRGVTHRGHEPRLLFCCNMN